MERRVCSGAGERLTLLSTAKTPTCEHDENRFAAPLPPAALPRRRYNPHRDLRLGSTPSFAMARTNVSNLAYAVVVVTEHNDGLQLGL